jgi:DNA-binding XRE family transcriptional regulator
MELLERLQTVPSLRVYRDEDLRGGAGNRRQARGADGQWADAETARRFEPGRLARFVDVDRQVIWRWEAGRARPSRANAIRYAQYLRKLQRALTMEAVARTSWAEEALHATAAALGLTIAELLDASAASPGLTPIAECLPAAARDLILAASHAGLR